jgi:hypothetical protein
MKSAREEFMGDSEINVDLWPAGVWTQNDLENFRNLIYADVLLALFLEQIKVEGAGL